MNPSPIAPSQIVMPVVILAGGLTGARLTGVLLVRRS
jgi:hypothetical protein